MALTQAEAAKLTNDMIQRGVILTVIKESSVLQRLPFIEVIGTALTYNREDTPSTVNWYDVGDTWTEDTPTFTKITAALKTLGGDADVDEFLQQTYRNPNDLTTEVILNKAKSMAYEWSDTFYNGSVSGNPKEFDGLATLFATGGARALAMGANGAGLTIDKLDELIDMVMPGRPDALLMAKRTRRKLSALRRNSGNLLEQDRNDFGLRATFYDGIEILVDDFIPTNEVQGSSGAVCSSIYAVKWGDQGLQGLQNGGMTVTPLGDLETKNARRHRLRWYASLALKSTLGGARLYGINAS